MKKSAIIIIAMVFGAAAFAAPGKITKSGKCKLYEAGISESEKIFRLDLKNEKIQAVCEFRGKASLGKFRLIGVPKMTNLTDKPLYVSYNVAFFDEDDNLVCCICQNSTLKPKTRSLQLASSLNNIPKDEFDKITSYKLVIHISDVPEEPKTE